MRIDRLKLENFGGFESFEIEFDPHFTLLVGDNASGKTSILDALTVLLESWVGGIKGDEKAGGIPPGYIRIVPHVFQDSSSFERQLPVRLQASGLVMGTPVTWARQRNRERGGTSYSETRNVAQMARQAGKSVRENSPVLLPLICSYGAERLWDEAPKPQRRPKRETKNGKPSRLDGYEDCLDFGIQEAVLSDWVRAQVLDGFQLGSKTAALRAAERAITSCVAGARTLIYSEREKELAFEIEPFGWQLLSNLSHGQRIMVILIGELARRATSLNPALGDDALEETPGVVLIDELDLHLHPKWQRHVIHDLKRTFPLVQFIATTHSPQLIGEARPCEIRKLEGGRAYSPSRSFGLDSSRVLGEIQDAPPRNLDVESLIHSIAKAIDEEKFEDARKLLVNLEAEVGPDDPEATRSRSLIKFLENPI